MGYQTEFDGEFTVEPPLSAAEVAYLKKFASTRHCEHQPSPFAADGTYGCPGTGSCGAAFRGMPGLNCDWEPNDDGTAISWNGLEKFYDADLWMAWLVRNLLGAEAADRLGPAATRQPDMRLLTCDHILDGVVDAQGEDPDDRWQLIVRGNAVTRRDAKPTDFGDETPL